MLVCLIGSIRASSGLSRGGGMKLKTTVSFGVWESLISFDFDISSLRAEVSWFVVPS